MEKTELIYERKATRMYATDGPNLLIQYGKDHAENAGHEVHHRTRAA
jgi:hypothetical protein